LMIKCRVYKYVLFRFFAYFLSLTWVNKGESVGVNYSNKKKRKKRYRILWGSNILI